MPWIKDKAKYQCDGCGKILDSHPKWERGEKTYSSVGCAVWDGWNPIDGNEVYSNETKEVDLARPITPMKPKLRARMKIIDWMPKTFA